MDKYSIELKINIMMDYRQGILGYKKLAKKYGLTRNVICGIIKYNKIQQNTTKD